MKHLIRVVPFRLAVSCSLMKLCLLCIKTLKRLCDHGSSAYGSLYCVHSDGCLGAVNPDCDAAYIWSSSMDGSNYRYMRLHNGVIYHNAYSANDTYSVRCVL